LLDHLTVFARPSCIVYFDHVTNFCSNHLTSFCSTILQIFAGLGAL
jgi:hypothetical protein